MLKSLSTYFNTEKSNAPLVVFRILFGCLMLFSIIRFVMMGWVHDFYIMPKLFFPFEGFYWLKPLPENGMYLVFAAMIVSSITIMLGWYYRVSSIIFFLSFTYVELLDKSNYLNHYYFVSIIAFILIFLPAHKRFSLDSYFNRTDSTHKTTNFVLWFLKGQLAIVYIFAGIAKLNPDWILNALPLKIWLPAHSHLPVIGQLLNYEWVAYLFSWFGALYDLVIVFFLLNNRTRVYAYVLVIIFHVLTRILFPIGMFPYIMILSTLIFFSENFHESILKFLSKIFKVQNRSFDNRPLQNTTLFKSFFVLFFCLQILIPFRYLFYPGDLFWTEQGYRFSWRVMLMEKAGTAFFYVINPDTGKKIEIDNKDFLTTNQEKMMATQPDMLVQYAHHLREYYSKRGIVNPKITADVFVNLNGRGSKQFIDPNIDLSVEANSWKPKNWILENED